jgi:hypothetical protein
MVWEHKFIKAHSTKTKCKDMVYINMHVVLFIKDNGKIINIMEKEFINSIMEQFMKENGKIILCMVQDVLLMLMVESGKVSIEMASFKLEDKENCYIKKKFRKKNKFQK